VIPRVLSIGMAISVLHVVGLHDPPRKTSQLTEEQFPRCIQKKTYHEISQNHLSECDLLRVGVEKQEDGIF